MLNLNRAKPCFNKYMYHMCHWEGGKTNTCDLTLMPSLEKDRQVSSPPALWVGLENKNMEAEVRFKGLRKRLARNGSTKTQLALAHRQTGATGSNLQRQIMLSQCQPPQTNVRFLPPGLSCSFWSRLCARLTSRSLFSASLLDGETCYLWINTPSFRETLLVNGVETFFPAVKGQ